MLHSLSHLITNIHTNNTPQKHHIKHRHTFNRTHTNSSKEKLQWGAVSKSTTHTATRHATHMSAQPSTHWSRKSHFRPLKPHTRHRTAGDSRSPHAHKNFSGCLTRCAIKSPLRGKPPSIHLGEERPNLPPVRFHGHSVPLHASMSSVLCEVDTSGRFTYIGFRKVR